MQDKPVFTTFEAAKLCHVSPLSIINWVNAGRLSAFRTPGGHRRIRREDLIRFMKDNGLPLPEGFEAGSDRRKVLVVDDDKGVRETLVELLGGRAKSYDVAAASDGFDAGRLLASFRPELVLLDLRMPGLDGFQICRKIKAVPECADTVVVAMTGYLTPETETRILECGAARCFAKPLDPTALLSFVDSVFERPGGAKPRRRRRPARA